ncbi:hypothetical protein [Streptomyces axinellae]|uniref:Uncharacterized protein n=1 Tax=Streptomyces axinellae TaxID=552788 RepID=A0ABP6D8B9_9ACTN
MGGTNGEKPGGGGETENPNVGPEMFQRYLQEKQYGKTGPPLVLAPEHMPLLPAKHRTNFENHSLAEMKALVEGTKPSDLEDVGAALYEASTAIKKAGSWLQREAGRVDWDGDAANAVGNWTEQLGKDTQKMGGFFEAVSTELTILSTGLTGVKNNMMTLKSEPPDNAPLLMNNFKGGGKGHSLKDIRSPAWVDSNPDYKYEKDRAAAIEQMNMLSSYYSVSQQAMDRAEAQKPIFRPLPDVGVPPALPGDGGWNKRTPTETGPGGSGANSQNSNSFHRPDDYPDQDGTPLGGGDRDSVTRHGREFVPPGYSEGDISTGLDSTPYTPTLNPPASGPPVTSQPTVPTPGGQNGWQPSPVAPPVGGFPPPKTTSPSLAKPGVAKSMPPVAPGRTGPGVPGPAGRPGLPGTGGTRPITGPAGRPVGPESGPRGMGRPGMMHPGTTGPGGANGGRGPVGGGTGARAIRPGIVGGTPGRSTQGGSSAIPRGTVVGNEGSRTGRGSAGMTPMGGKGRGKRKSKDTDGPGQRIASTPGGIVGEPRSGESGQGRRPGEFTEGGAGLVRNEDQREPGERGGNEPRRPNYLTENEETGPGGQHNSVPPVVE